MGSTYPAVASRAQIFPAGDGAFLQRWDGAGDGSEANDGGDNGCEVDHFVCGEGIFWLLLRLGEVVVVDPERFV